MIDSNTLRLIADAQAMVDRLAPNIAWLKESIDRATRFADDVRRMGEQFASPFQQMVLQDRTWTYVQNMVEERNQLLAGLDRHRNARMLISAQLPKRGWYLSGQEPCTLSLRLAKSVGEGDWDQVDQEMMEHLPEFKMDLLRQWLTQEGVPDYCINRLCRFVKHHQEGNYEEATYIGVPMLDELARHLYRGKTFTTKRASRGGGDQSKPELAFKTSNGPDLSSYCEQFVQVFGSLQENSDQRSLADENYWNRHAIVHGQMQRAMGLKDSAKCLMAVNFLLFARNDGDETPEKD